MTLQECQEQHYEMWDWLSKNPTKNKVDYFSIYPKYKRKVPIC